MSKLTGPVLALAVLALPLAACGESEENTAYEADVEDLGGGEIQVREPVEGEVPVDLPETEMTSVPPEEVPADPEADTAAE
ncbi:MAG: hypothetical protein JY451_04910 [Erythrobacter sp.]|nr:MAG: hypothetical protein JY451_04910 [Erythrobacter sp.]